MRFNKYSAKSSLKVLVFFLTAFILLINSMNILGFDSLKSKTVNARDGASLIAPQGLGTQESPFLISSAKELAWVASEANLGNLALNQYYELTQDIDLDQYEWEPIGNYNDGTLTTAFSGNFEGNGFSISNLKITDVNMLQSQYIGLFGYVYNSTIKNLYLKDVNINLIGDYSELNSGFIIGSLLGSIQASTIQKITATGAIVLNDSQEDVIVSGLIGLMSNTDLSKSYSSIGIAVDVDSSVSVGGVVANAYQSDLLGVYNSGQINVSTALSYNLGGVVAKADLCNITKSFNEGAIIVQAPSGMVGGLVGVYGETTPADQDTYAISHTYNVGSITVNNPGVDINGAVGGLVGLAQEKHDVSYSYNAGTITLFEQTVPLTEAGAIVGSLAADTELSNSYYDIEKTSLGISGAGVNLGVITKVAGSTTIDMRKIDTYSDWDFYTTWISTTLNNYYPVLRYVGNVMVDIQRTSGGTTTVVGLSAYEIGRTIMCGIQANSGYQIQKLVFNNEEIYDYRGKEQINFSIIGSIEHQTLVVVFEKAPFYKTLGFYILLTTAVIIILMIVGTIIINHNYDVEMGKMMVERKRGLDMIKASHEHDNEGK